MQQLERRRERDEKRASSATRLAEDSLLAMLTSNEKSWPRGPAGLKGGAWAKQIASCRKGVLYEPSPGTNDLSHPERARADRPSRAARCSSK